MNAQQHLSQHAADLQDEVLQKALDGDTNAAATLWREIASGVAGTTQTVVWAQHIAQRIVVDVIEGDALGAARPRAALAAIGFRGRTDVHVEAREAVEVIRDFFPDLTPPQALQFLHARGLMSDIPRKVALTRISEWLKS